MPPPLRPDVIDRQAAVGQVAVSPDGATVVYTRRTVRRGADVIGLWAVPAAGGRPRALTRGSWRDTLPRFSPDGTHLAFLRAAGSDPGQVHLLPLAGGEPWAATAFGKGASDLDWTPDGGALAVLATDARSPLHVGERDDGEPTARLVARLDWRSDGSGLQLRPTHVHLVRFRPGADDVPRARRLTSGPLPAWRPRVSPDGTRVAFLADLRPDGDLAPCAAVHAVPLAGGEPEPLTDLPGPVVRFAFDADGGLVCIGFDVERPADDDPPRLWRVAPGGATTLLSDGVQHFVGDVGHATDLVDWMTDGDDAGAVTTVARSGLVTPVRFGADGPAELVPDALGPMTHSLAAGGGTVAATLSLAGEPAEVYVLDGAGGAPRRLTTHGGAWIRRHARPRVEERVIDGPAGPIQTFLLHPPAGTGPHATVLEVHGGPTGSWGPTPPLDALLLASRGYLVCLPNIRGSHNQGREWIRALAGRWGDVDAEDCHAVLDQVVGDGLADPARLGCLGLSYGGFMVNWLVATSDRFAAGVSENGVTNQVSSFGNCDVGAPYCTAAGLGDVTTPAGVESLWRMSPLRHVAAVRTPLLILQAEGDLRCPPSDNEQLFVALRWLGRPVEYVLYPEESHAMHGLGRPDRRRDRHERVLAWFERHMPPGPV